MSSNENFCLSFNNFGRNVKIAWKEMQMEGDFCDVTLACEDKQMKTHKLIISSYSPVLRNILKFNQTPHPIIYLRRVKYKNLQNLLNFMYQGEVNVAEEDLPSFLEFAEDLNVRGLSEGNKETYTSNFEPSKLINSKNIDPPECNGKNFESDNNKNISDIQSGDSINEHGQADESFIVSNNASNNLFTEMKNEGITDNKSDTYTENHTVSTLFRKQFECGKCDKQYSGPGGLSLHTKTVHEGAKYSCEQCNYKATQKSGLKKHVMTIHEGRRYPCDQCDYKATETGSLRKHQRKHLN